MKTTLLLLALAALLPSIGQAGMTVRFEVPRYQLDDTERETVAACLVLEAACQGRAGMEGVMAVISNRAGGSPERFYAVATARKQFSAFDAAGQNPKLLRRLVERAKGDRTWPLALEIVAAAESGYLIDRTGGATFYARSDSRPYWLRSVRRTTTIGDHCFFVPSRS